MVQLMMRPKKQLRAVLEKSCRVYKARSNNFIVLRKVNFKEIMLANAATVEALKQEL